MFVSFIIDTWSVRQEVDKKTTSSLAFLKSVFVGKTSVSLYLSQQFGVFVEKGEGNCLVRWL